MPRYFIDVDMGDTFVRDQDGADYADFGTARHEALVTLADVSRVRIADGGLHDFTGSVRDADGNVVFKASLSMTFEPH